MTAKRSPLDARADDLERIAEGTAGRVVVEHVPLLAQVSLRLDPVDAGRAPFPLPLEPNTAWEDQVRVALWLGPDEWLVLGHPLEGPTILAELRAAFAGTPHSAVDVSASRVSIHLGGDGAREVLEQGCSLDLDPRGGWNPGRCAQTLLARVPVILHEREGGTTVLVRSSFADYLVDWLIDAAASAATR